MLILNLSLYSDPADTNVKNDRKPVNLGSILKSALMEIDTLGHGCYFVLALFN
jgi:hypothetical protein